MDSSPDDGVSTLGSDSESDDRDLRDVLGHLVVAGGGRGATERAGDEATLSAVARAAGGSDRLVPELLGALDDDATAVRVGAAWTLCALADDQPAAVEYLATSLVDRVDDGPFEVGQVFSYLRGRYPGRVADAVDVAVTTERLGGQCARSDRTPVDPGTSGRQAGRPADAAASDDADKRVETDGGVPAGTVADLGDGRQVVRPSGARSPRPAGPDAAGPTPVRHTDEPPSDRARPDVGAGDDGAGATARSRTDADAGERTPARPARTDEPGTPDTFAAIGSLSSLDRLSAVDSGVEERYAEGYRCRAVRDDEERGVSVRLFERPDEDDRLAFQSDLEDCLGRWQTFDDDGGVVTVAEWGRRPRPWVRTQPVDASLAERGPPDVARALDQAVALAEAVATLHAHGAVHAGLDPQNVVYPCDPLDALERPMLDNVGLMGVFRQYFEPANYLDPRFAAPEYYDDDFGSVDAATDVYGLGAVVYYLLTRRPPFEGSYGEVRAGVLDEQPTPPSDARDAVPPRADPVLAKALAKSKLARYDAVEGLLSDLRGVRDCG